MITDIHCHFVPDEFFRFAQARDEFAIRIKRREGDLVDLDIRGMHFGLNTTFFEMDKQRERMQRDGVERTILSLATPFIDYYLDAKVATEAARVFNDSLASAIAPDRTRFGGWALLPMQDPQAAATELRRCVRDHGFVGGHIASNVRGVYLHDERFEPIFQAAVDLNVPLFVHPADPLGKDRTREYELTIVAGYLFDNTINILKMICSGFLDRWPTLKLVCAHAGAFSPVLRARMQREVDTNPALSSTLTMPVGDYLRRLYFDTICFEPAILRYVADVVPVEHLMLGSDAPFPLGEPDPVNFVKNALPADQVELILRRNFDRMLEA
ncbi:amidohydrolase family protein [Tardiphaga sp. vice352]|uniref:amidohydrolase family protein n=1 Tax=unclassified Tardiphaga TaxID=2631404 RepID=UPI001163FE6B|nr:MULTISPECIES: amidohydrolase family protein [unclassified Tardiphaga]MBC7583208.1 amidohydrolase family protein [Tardiphaga sp.]QDM18039.1 amidohydrolase family protein [Tardiphaga sp. vice278]QDM23079.1 amidohydrolase family protein [Tardiphaga sp. vice154]QDM28244.1 amidohydrolase family protein [Tardiphaga sp. vice304]QDM33387.1 amidohydrolase family protein [Tardiphaga sp. vice352]